MGLNVAVVEDDADLAEEVLFHLRRANFAAIHCRNGAELDKLLAAQEISVVVLDLGLPGEDGLSIAKRLIHRSDLRIVMLTARASVLDRLQGFEAGADIYLTKPVNMQELVRVINNVARRLAPSKNSTVLDIKVGVIEKGSLQAKLTGLEISFLQAMALSKELKVSKIDMETRLYKTGDESAHRKLEVMLSRLRTKLKAAGFDDLIQTEWGSGFRLAERILIKD